MSDMVKGTVFVFQHVCIFVWFCKHRIRSRQKWCELKWPHSKCAYPQWFSVANVSALFFLPGPSVCLILLSRAKKITSTVSCALLFMQLQYRQLNWCLFLLYPITSVASESTQVSLQNHGFRSQIVWNGKMVDVFY